MFLKFTVFVLTFFGVGVLQAQNSPATYNSLLWRITKPGIASHSYLYGTMHATQKKLFYFTDSLYHFIESTDGFATELDMKDLFPVMLESEMQDKLKTKLVVDVVRSEWLAPIKGKLEKRFGKPIGKLKVSELKSIQAGFANDFIRKGEMNTIMDIYLSETARRLGKWTGGIEDFEDQLKVKDSEEYVMTLIYSSLAKTGQSQEFLDKLIKIYLDEDLDKIDLSSELWRGSEKIVLTNRNIKMARRIDSLIQIRSNVFAVGAAHIPGDSGLVELLRNKGYTVSPVYSKNRISPDSRPMPAEIVEWKQIYESDNFYNVLMPGKPTPLQMEDRPGYEPMIFTDLSNLNFYMSVGFDISGAKEQSTDELFSKLKDGFASRGSIKSEKSIEVEGIKGKEYIIRNKDADMRLQMFLPGKHITINVLAVYRYDSLFSKRANRFFESISFNSKLVNKSSESKIAWKTHEFASQGFKVDFPGKFTKKQGFGSDVDSVWDVNVYSYLSKNGELGCWMIVMEAKPGYYSNVDSGYFELVKERNEENLGTKASLYRQFLYKGYPACELLFDFKVKAEKGKMFGRVINKGNKRYYYYSICTPGSANEAEAKRFLESFSFVDLPKKEWGWNDLPGSGLKLWAPEAFISRTSEEDSSFIMYQSFDRIFSNTILVTREPISKYQWWLSDSSFFAQLKYSMEQEGDSLISFAYDTLVKYSSMELVYSMTGNHLLKKVKVVPYGDTLYRFFSFASPADFNSGDYKKLFNQIDYTDNKPGNLYRISKAKMIFEDLNSADSATFEDATSAISSVPFRAEDLGLLQQAVLKNYRDSGSGYYSAKRRIIDEVINLDDGTTLEFIRKNYPLLKGKDEKIKTDLLYLLASLSTTESFTLLKQYALNDKPKEGDITELGFRLTDSIELTKKLFPDLLPLTSDTSWATLFTYVLPNLIDSGYLKTEQLKPYYDNFYRLADLKIPQLISDSSFNWDILSITEVLGRIPTKESYERLYKLGKSNNFDIRIEAFVSLAVNGQEVPPNEWEIIASDKSFRLELYNRLLKIKKDNLFPVKYKNQKSLTESELYMVACDDDIPQSFEFIGERSFKYKGKTEKFLLFKAKYVYDDEVSESLLFAGPYRKGLVTESEVATMASDPFDPKKINEQVKQELKWYEKQ